MNPQNQALPNHQHSRDAFYRVCTFHLFVCTFHLFVVEWGCYMRALLASELLQVWELGFHESPLQQALLLLAAACSDSQSQLAQLSIGKRDAMLLTLREWTFGSQIQSLAACPKCGERLELNFNVADIRVATPIQPAEMSLNFASYYIEFRLPNSFDLIAITTTNADKKALLERCLVKVFNHGEAQETKQLPTDVTNALIAQMAKADPQADVQLNLFCPACSHQWQSTFDIVSFFWSEIHAWAIRILREVHILASAYGWQEADILAMSPYRRQLYLKMVER